MERIENWDNIEAKGMDDFKSLPIGAYECVIVGAGIHESEQSGKRSFKVAVDIAKGDFKDYFKKRFDNNQNEKKKWDNNAVRYLAFEGDSIGFFKGFITCIEKSNVGYKWNWQESSLKGKKICGVFQYEEYEKQDGSKGIKVRLNKFRSLDKLGEIKVNDSIKLLNGEYMPYNEYKEKKLDEAEEQYVDFGNAVEIADDELAF